jgi:hypothetical protein
MAERRQHERVSADYPVKVIYTRGIELVEESARLINVCTGGLKFKFMNRLEEGSRVGLEINTPGVIANDLLGIKGLDPKQKFCMKSSAVVVRSGPKDESEKPGYVAVKFNGPKQVTMA